MSTRPHIPPATPAPTDLFCWLWAAYPPTPAGRLSSGRIAASLGVSARTLRRWISDDRTDLLTPRQRAQLSRRAILRGRGTYLWPLVGLLAVIDQHTGLSAGDAYRNGRRLDERGRSLPPER